MGHQKFGIYRAGLWKFPGQPPRFNKLSAPDRREFYQTLRARTRRVISNSLLGCGELSGKYSPPPWSLSKFYFFQERPSNFYVEITEFRTMFFISNKSSIVCVLIIYILEHTFWIISKNVGVYVYNYNKYDSTMDYSKNISTECVQF